MTLKSEQETEPSVFVESAPAGALGLADLSFVKCLEHSALGELWKVETPAKKTAFCQFLPPQDPAGDEEVLGRLQVYRHRSLAAWTPVRGAGNRLALLSPVSGPTLRERFQELWNAKQPGVPRDELLDYLRPVAVALDLLQARHHIQHLWLHPRQFILHEDRSQVLGFGLAEVCWPLTGRPLAELNPRYFDPQLLRSAHAPNCDQYSLALIYAEMLTGLHPWRNRPAVSGAADPDLGMLAKKDQAIVQRALSPNPRRRFSSMTEMMAALGEASDVFRPPLKHLLVPSDLEQAPPASVLACTTLDHFVRQLVYMVDCRPESAEEMRIRFAIEPPLPLASFPKPNEAEVHGQAAPFRLLDEFCQKWHAKAVHYKDGLTLVAINAAPSLWQRLRGQRHGLEIRVQFLPVGSGYERSEVSVVVKPFGCDRASAAHLLEALGPQLLDSVRACLHARPEQRGRERFAVRQRLQIRPVIHGAPAPAIECVSKDISAGGICFLVPGELAASEVYVSVPAHAQLAPYAALAHIVRKQPAQAGWFEVGAAFPSALLGHD